MMGKGSRFTTYNSIQLETEDLERLSQIGGLQQLLTNNAHYGDNPNISGVARGISECKRQNYFRNGCRHRVLGDGPKNASLIPNFVCYLGRIIKAETGHYVSPKELKVVPSGKKSSDNELFSKHALKLPNGSTVVEHIIGGGHVISHGFDVTRPSCKPIYVEYFSTTDAAS
jgi:hypothetical protein